MSDKRTHDGRFKTGVPDKRRANRQVKNVAHVYQNGKRLTIPQLARTYSGLAVHVLASITAGRDADSIKLGSTDLEILQGAIPETPISNGDRIKAAMALLDRGHGRPLDSEAMLKLDSQSAPINALSTQDLLSMLEPAEIEESP